MALVVVVVPTHEIRDRVPIRFFDFPGLEEHHRDVAPIHDLSQIGGPGKLDCREGNLVQAQGGAQVVKAHRAVVVGIPDLLADVLDRNGLATRPERGHGDHGGPAIGIARPILSPVPVHVVPAHLPRGQRAHEQVDLAPCPALSHCQHRVARPSRTISRRQAKAGEELGMPAEGHRAWGQVHDVPRVQGEIPNGREFRAIRVDGPARGPGIVNQQGPAAGRGSGRGENEEKHQSEHGRCRQHRKVGATPGKKSEDCSHNI